jgi:phage-related tail fiber protein
MACYNHIPHVSVLATREYVKRTVSALANGAICIGGKAVSEGLLLIKNYTSTVPCNL